MNKIMMMPFNTNRNNNSHHQIRRSTTNKMKMKMMMMKKKKKISDDDNNDILNSSNSSSVTTDTDTDFSEKTHDEYVIKSEGETETRQHKKKNKNKVRFSVVHIRQYNLCLGDNPSVSHGPPISLDWDYDNEIIIDLHEYEQYNHNHNHSQRDRIEFKRPSFERFDVLKQLGYSRTEINEATHQMEKIRQQRYQTRRHLQRMDTLRSFFFFVSNTKNDSTTGIRNEHHCPPTTVRLVPVPLIHRDSFDLP
mmetsp:Transcript_37089/g.37546  ORF Transcript_37089/g.37546 Transcript_37089/m.37546 type:complete len:250 (+) Transcript_37089:52-801(+)